MSTFVGSCPVVGVYKRGDNPTSFTVLIEGPGVYLEWETPWPPAEGDTVIVRIEQPGTLPFQEVDPPHHLGEDRP